MKFLLVRQPAGMGDIFYLQKAIQDFINDGYKVIWPLADVYYYLKDYIKNLNIEFYNETKNFPYKQLYYSKTPLQGKDGDTEVLFIPFQDADALLKMPAMKAKYPLVNKDSNDWQSYFNFERNPEREARLKTHYGITDGQDFIFINNTFGSPPQMFTRTTKVESKETRLIYNDLTLKYSDGSPIHLFDYCWLFEHAKEIHTVETSFCYLIEKLNTTDKLFMYSRTKPGNTPNSDFSYIDHIYKKKWECIP